MTSRYITPPRIGDKGDPFWRGMPLLEWCGFVVCTDCGALIADTATHDRSRCKP